jgi:two-component system, LytTR family, response regulator
MIKTILIDSELQVSHFIKSDIEKHCPQVNLCGTAFSCAEAALLIKEHTPSLAIIDSCIPKNDEFYTFKNNELSGIETIYLSNCPDFAAEAFKYQASGFVLKPIKTLDLIATLESVQKRIEQKEKLLENLQLINQLSSQKPPGNLIGIPTFEGFDFISVADIIRCEGMQKCTRIIIKDKEELISSYNIGEFIKLLESFQFFSPHKSHLINLIHLKKYYKDGTIKMSDGSCIPVSKRRKSLFLKSMLLSR